MAWPPSHAFPRCSRASHILGVILLRAWGWRLGRPLPEGVSKAVLIAAPHTSNWDFWFALLASWSYGLKIRWLGKDALFNGPLGPLLARLGGMAVDRSAPHGLVGEVARLFREEPGMLLMVPAEGTRGYRDHWRSGFWFMAREAGVPILLGSIDYRNRVADIGGILHPTDDVRADMDIVRARYADAHPKYPDQFSRIRLRQEDDPDAE